MGVLLRWQQPPPETDWDQTEIQFDTTLAFGSPTTLTTITDITTTNFYDEDGSSSRFYRIRFINSVSGKSAPFSDIIEGDEVGGFCSVQEVRQFMQFGRGDNPSTTDIAFEILQTKVKIDEEFVGGESDAKKKLLHLLLASSYIMRSLAMRALRRGYVTSSVDGRTIQKAYTELMDAAEKLEEQYRKEQNKLIDEISITRPLRFLETDTKEDIIDIFQGGSDGTDFEDHLSDRFARRRRLS